MPLEPAGDIIQMPTGYGQRIFSSNLDDDRMGGLFFSNGKVSTTAHRAPEIE